MSHMGTDAIKYALNNVINKRKEHQRSHFGETPNLHYFDGDMRGIRTYYDYRYDNRLDDFLIDDTTWNDLSIDDLYKRINQGFSTSGEQYLYYLLRSPSIEKSEYDKREKMIELMEKHPDMRQKLQVILTKLGRRRAANTCEVFHPPAHSLGGLFIHILLVFLLLGSAAAIVFTPKAVLPFLCFLIFVPLYHQFISTRIESDLATVNYSVAMVYAQKKIRKISFLELDSHISSFYDAGKRLKSILRIGAISTSTANEIVQLLYSLLLIDLISYELLKNRLGKHHTDIFHIHECLGRIDSAIAIASYRKSVGGYAIPQIDFVTGTKVRFFGKDMVHPLITNAIANNLETTEPILLTGSNASGKSTFLKTIALNAIMAQSICTALCNEYLATAFRVYSSMAITDDILAGESYYISEIKSLKRIADAVESKKPILCVIDEVLRGTNTVERIAASSELLISVGGNNVLCLAATHDIELCTLLDNTYRLFHFEETITNNGEILFDYRIRKGAAITRNALKLLSSIGFDSKMISRANDRANMYMATGTWVQEGASTI